MPFSGNISWLDEVTLDDRPSVGGKGGSLGELTRAGIAVPPGFVVRTSAFEQVLHRLEQEDAIRSRVEKSDVHDLFGMTTLAEKLHARFARVRLPDDVRAEILAAHAQLCGADQNWPLAVRSSATVEDSEEASFAGLQDTYLWVRGVDATLKSVRSCWSSLYSVPSISYRRKHAMPEDGVAIAVVVQKMVDARSAGVMFTRSPLTGDRSVITIESTWGLGSALVGGEVTPDRFVIAKITGEISVREISDKHIQHVPAHSGGIKIMETPEPFRRQPSVSDKELDALKQIGRAVEQHYGEPQDIEWAIDHSGAICLLQSRPETVWSTKEKIPVARPAENPLFHLMNIFGGRR